MSDYTKFTDLAASKGAGVKLFYSVSEVSNTLGISESTLRREIAEGRLKYHLPTGRLSGKRIRPEWVEEWIQAGTHA